MRNVNILLSFFFCWTTFWLSAQRIDNTVSFLNVNSDKYFRFHYENDYFTATDRYYTQGPPEWVPNRVSRNLSEVLE